MFCNKCGNEISNDAKFCTKCGNKVESIKNKIQKREYEFSSITNGGKSKIIIEAGKMTIIRPGVISKFSHGFTGEKTILIKDISAVQLKLAGISRGYLQFIFVGSMEARSGMLRGEKNENIIYFDAGINNNKVNNNAKEIKEYIENYNGNNTINTVTNIYNTNDKYDKLEKIKRLLEQGILTKEEFEVEKTKILQSK